MKNFWTRFLSGLLYASFITITIFYSNFTFKVLITFLSIMVIKEYFNLINYNNYFYFLLVLFFIWTPKNLIIYNYIIIAKTSDFKIDVSDAMSAIKNKYGKSIPLNITNIHPTNTEKNSNFISYKRTSKELYLLLRDVNK